MIVPVVILVVAFAGAVYLSRGLVPALAESRTGQLAGRVSVVLIGAAGAVLALNVYLAIKAAVEDVYEGFSRGEAITYALTNGLWQGGLLLAAAAAVHLLAPAGEDDADEAGREAGA